MKLRRPLPPFSRQHLAALCDSFSGFPGNKLPIHVPGRESHVQNTDSSRKESSRRQASVFVPFCNRHGVPSVLFTVRTDTVGSHKGHVSFPGGHREDTETAEAAALRELQEELDSEGDLNNLSSVSRATVLGECQTIPALTGTIVTPIVGFLHDDVGNLSDFTPDNNEVDHIFTRSLEELLAPDSRKARIFTHKGVAMTLPEWGDDGDDERIWGLTACVLEAVLDQLIVPYVKR